MDRQNIYKKTAVSSASTADTVDNVLNGYHIIRRHVPLGPRLPDAASRAAGRLWPPFLHLIVLGFAIERCCQVEGSLSQMLTDGSCACQSSSNCGR